MTEEKSRDTFNDNAEVLRRLEKKSQWAERCLTSKIANDENVREHLLIDDMIKSQSEITHQIHNCLVCAPQEVLDNYNQFSTEDESEVTINLGDIVGYGVQKAMKLNNEIKSEVLYLLKTDQNDLSRTMFENLHNVIDLKIRNMSVAAQTVRDI